MSRKIFNSIWLVALTVFFASLTFIMGVTYSYFSGVQRSQLRLETQLAARGVALNGADFFKGLDSEDYRITWIAADGSILYDSEAANTDMENHMEREEVREAFDNGYGEGSRYSQTLSQKLFYSAKLLPDGTVLRLSGVQNTLWSLLLGFAQPIAIVASIAFALSLFWASRLSRRIVEPINRIDPDSPASYLGKKEYEEVEPLLRKMSAQQAEIRHDQAELEKASLIRQEFTANASHELKTPLHAISGYAELLEHDMVRAEDIRPFAGKIRQEAQRMTQLVEDIIGLTRLDGGAKEMARERIDLYQIARNAIDSVQNEAELCSVSLHLSGESAILCGVAPVLYSIIYNLCDNAVKYNRPGGSVEVLVEDRDASVLLYVRDTGVGIPKESQGRIFERFYRVDKSHSREIGGTGLGLSIVKHGVLIHRAKISVESELDHGTAFTVVFPKE